MSPVLDPSSGFFDRVTNCHFGSGNWVTLAVGQQTVPFTARLDLPDIAEGEPGFPLFAGTSPNPQFHNIDRSLPITVPVNINPAWLTGKLTTQGGAKLTGFGMGVSANGTPIHRVPGSTIFLSLDKFSPTKPIRLIFGYQSSSHLGDEVVACTTFRKVSATNLFTRLVDSQSFPSANRTFRIDPKTLRIS